MNNLCLMKLKVKEELLFKLTKVYIIAVATASPMFMSLWLFKTVAKEKDYLKEVSKYQWPQLVAFKYPRSQMFDPLMIGSAH